MKEGRQHAVDLRGLGREARERARGGEPPPVVADNGDMFICCGRSAVFDADSELLVCQGCRRTFRRGREVKARRDWPRGFQVVFSWKSRGDAAHLGLPVAAYAVVADAADAIVDPQNQVVCPAAEWRLGLSGRLTFGHLLLV